jgi:hypothetical protein
VPAIIECFCWLKQEGCQQLPGVGGQQQIDQATAEDAACSKSCAERAAELSGPWLFERLDKKYKCSILQLPDRTCCCMQDL